VGSEKIHVEDVENDSLSVRVALVYILIAVTVGGGGSGHDAFVCGIIEVTNWKMDTVSRLCMSCESMSCESLHESCSN
jgi:hypothetical protein